MTDLNNLDIKSNTLTNNNNDIIAYNALNGANNNLSNKLLQRRNTMGGKTNKKKELNKLGKTLRKLKQVIINKNNLHN